MPKRPAAIPESLQLEVTEETIARLVREFYNRVRLDPTIGHVFEERLAGRWEEHLVKLTDFWSQLTLRSGRYNGRPLPVHAPLKLQPEHFTVWLRLFSSTARDLFPPATAEFFVDRAQRIAESFMLGLNIGSDAEKFRVWQATRPPDDH